MFRNNTVYRIKYGEMISACMKISKSEKGVSLDTSVVMI